MSIWQILGIEPTTDLQVIKKAYSEKLKQHHPEEDPEGFKQLRQAYELAIKPQSTNTQNAAAPPPEEVPTNHFIEKLNAIANKAEKRFLTENYDALMDELNSFDIDDINALAEPTLFWGYKLFLTVPNEVLNKLSQRFKWKDLSLNYEGEQAYAVDDFLNQIQEQDIIDYTSLSHLSFEQQNLSLRYIRTMKHYLITGRFDLLYLLLQTKTSLYFPNCPRAYALLIRSYNACKIKVSNYMLEHFEAVLKSSSHSMGLIELDCDWLLADLYKYQGLPELAFHQMAKHIHKDLSLTVRTWVLDLFYHTSQEWVPFWTSVLKPKIKQANSPADLILLRIVEKNIYKSDYEHKSLVLDSIKHQLNGSKKLTLPPLLKSGKVSVDLKILYALLHQVQSPMNFFYQLPIIEKNWELLNENSSSVYIKAIEMLLEHHKANLVLTQKLNELNNTLKINEKPVASDEKILLLLTLNPSIHINLLRWLFPFSRLESTPKYDRGECTDLINWVQRRQLGRIGHWVEQIDYNDSSNAKLITQLCMIIDCAPSRLFTEEGRDLLESITQQQEYSQFAKLGEILLKLQFPLSFKSMDELFEKLYPVLKTIHCTYMLSNIFYCLPIRRHFFEFFKKPNQWPPQSAYSYFLGLYADVKSNETYLLLFKFFMQNKLDSLSEAQRLFLQEQVKDLQKVIILESGNTLNELVNLELSDFKTFVQKNYDSNKILVSALALYRDIHISQIWPDINIIANLSQIYATPNNGDSLELQLLCGFILEEVEKHIETLKKTPKKYSPYNAGKMISFSGRLNQKQFLVHGTLGIFYLFMITLLLKYIPPGLAIILYVITFIYIASAIIRRQNDLKYGMFKSVVTTFLSFSLMPLSLIVSLIYFYKKPTVHNSATFLYVKQPLIEIITHSRSK